jgi:hypothetical protein
MNKGADQAKGNWIYFIGAGDRMKKVLHEVVARLQNPFTIYYGDVFHSEINRRYDGRFSGWKLAVNNICHQSIFYPAYVFKKYRYNLSYQVLADHELNMKCYGDNLLDFSYMPLIICTYEGGGISAQRQDVNFYRDKPDIIRKNFPFPVYFYSQARRKTALIIKTSGNGLG